LFFGEQAVSQLAAHLLQAGQLRLQ
jgi:hypothetical protein